MPISHLLKTIFIHIPKTGGTSVEAALGMHGEKRDIGIRPYFNQTIDTAHLYGRDLQHMTAAHLKTKLGDDVIYDAYFKFSIVRNPWERLVSTCAWAGQKWAKGDPLRQPEFDDIVRQLYERFEAARSASQTLVLPPHLAAQHTFICDSEMRPMVDCVARYENLAEEWPRISKKIGIDVPLGSRMKSHHQPYQDYYRENTRKMVAEIYARDTSMYRYAF